MKQNKMWKRVLSVMLSVCMVAGLITISESPRAVASETANILVNGDFENANSAWVDQNGSSVPAQALVDDVKITSEVKFLNDFAGSSPTWGWNINNTTTSVVEKDGNKVLSFAPGSNKYITNYGFLGWNNQFVVGENYRISCRVYSDTEVSFRLYENGTEKYDLHTTTAGDWSTYTIDIAAKATGTTLYFHFMDGSSGPVYIDDLKIEQITTKINKETVYTSEFTNDFSGSSPTWGWNINNTATSVVEKDGNKVLSFAPGGNKYVYNYNLLNYSGLTVGENYRISCRVYSDTEVSFRLYDDTTGKYDLHTTTAGDWSTYTIDIAATAAKPALYFHFMDNSSGPVYIDDLVIEKPTEAIAKIYTEGIGTCKNAEPDNVLVMKDYTKVAQPVAITSGVTYSYSFDVKGVDMAGDFVASVVAGGQTVQTITATSEWTTIQGEFTATANATDFGFARTGVGELWIDDVVLIPSVTEPTPEDHTSVEGPYIPENQAVVFSQDMSTSSNLNLGSLSTATVEDGMLKLPYVAKNQYVQTNLIAVTAGTEYTLSFYVYAVDVEDGFNFNIFASGAGNGYKDKAVTSVTADTEGWQLITYKFTATSSASIRFGFQNYGEGAGTVYVDDMALCCLNFMANGSFDKDGTYDATGWENISESQYVEAIKKYEVVENGDFSAGNASSGKNGWYGNNAASLQVVNEPGNESNKVLAIKTTGVGVAFFEVSTPTYEIGKTYTVSFKVRSTAGDIGFTNYTEGIGSGWKSHGWKNGTTTWKTISYEVEATQSAAWAQVGIQFEGATGDNQLYIDDFSISYTGVEMETSVTNVVQNGDFSAGNASSGNNGWYGNNAASLQVVNESGNESNKVLAIKTTGVGVAFFEVSTPTYETGKTYTVSFKVRSTAGNIGFTNYTEGIGTGWKSHGWKNGTTTWQTVSYEIEATQSVAWAQVGIQFDGATGDNQLYIDDVSISTSETAIRYKNTDGLLVEDGDYALFMSEMTSAMNTVTGAKLKEGTTYEYSFYVKNKETSSDFALKFCADSIEETVMSGAHESSDTWTLVTGSFEVPAGGVEKIGFERSGIGEVYIDDIVISVKIASNPIDITLSYGTGSNFHYEQENRLYIQSTGTERKDFIGTLKINGTEVSMKYEHHNGGLVLLFDGKLSETDVNTVVIPEGTILYDGRTAVYNITNSFTIYTQKVADGQWMTWLSEYDYQGSDVLYYDMGTEGTKYVFNNTADITYQGVLIVTGKASFMLGGTQNGSQEVTDLGDYKVSRTIKGEKYDYTVALYKRGDADKTQDGKLTAKDLVASKKAVNATSAEFGYARYKAADSNTDGVVNEEDATFMRHILVNDEYDITTTTSKGYSTLGQGVMPIIGYSGPSNHATSTNQDLKKRSELGYQDDFLTDSVFSLVKDLGFNTFINQVNEVGNDYETSTKMLKLAEKYGLGVFVNNAYVSNQAYVQEQLPIQTAKYDSFSSFHGYYVADEPTTDEISNYTKTLTAMKNYVHMASYFNMLPMSDSDFLLGGYETYMNKAAATDAEALSYDLYLRGQNKTLLGQTIRTSDFYKNLDIARTASINKYKPFYAFVQTGTQFESTNANSVVAKDKMVTIQEMYLEANAALAMGAKGINYFTLVQGTTDVSYNDGDLYSSGLITLAGKANHGKGGSTGDGNNYNYYDAAKKINTFIAAIDEVLMNASNKGVISNNSTVTANVTCKLSNYGAVQSVTGNECMVGCFDYYGKDVYLIVNITPDEGNSGSSQNITLNFNGTYSYTATDMACKETVTSGQSARFTVGAGEAILVVVE